MSGKRRAALILLSALAAAVLIAGVAIYRGAEIRFILKDRIEKLGGGAELTETEVSGVETSLESLKSDPRVSFDQSLMLINEEHLLKTEPEIAEYKDSGVMMNACITSAYSELSGEVSERFGEKLFVSSSFRTEEEQRQAIAEEGKKAQSVGASEHQAGLALDVYVRYYAGEAFLKHEAGQWVNSNCQDYGFIIRYPYYGKAKTGIGYEPWHIRYVGLPHSMIIADGMMTLEEYIEGLEPGMFYECGEYLISRQTDGFYAPAEFESAVVSPDNTGGYILTFRLGE